MASVILEGLELNRRDGRETIEVLSDEEEEILELEEAPPELRLLARVLGTKHFNPQAFSYLMGRNPSRGIEAEQLGQAPWFFEKRVVVLREVTSDEVLTQVELFEVPIWVQMNNIPWNQRPKTNVINIAERVGSFITLDEKGKQGWGKFVRARVLMHVEKSIRKSLFIRTGKGEKVEVTYRYEGLPNFYYICGRMDHLLKECDLRNKDLDEEQRTTFGE
ncbi:hypothetical protein Tsubulata_026073 [Turnera subulata]|uniref:Zinc knuckle CX2CX4HX4C domain-containing protein n=1 Tax=Turnera subulata TaxID=218843 RepID=A0A9Q0JIT1_9ROSI|nr:hypothetical protein Tsubulata_026073 [Turnera subulata]